MPVTTLVVVGGTGTVGSRLLGTLAQAGVLARVLVRSKERGARARELGHEVVVGDADDRPSLDAALRGVERLFLLLPTTGPEHLEREMRVLDAAANAGTRHVVKVSAIAADPGSPVRLAASHGRAEAHLRETGMQWTLLRPNDLMSNLLGQAGAIAGQGAFFGPLDPSVRISSVDPQDVADVAARALQGTHLDEESVLTGPDAPTRDELAAMVGDAAGREVRYVSIGADDFRGAMRGAGIPAWTVEGLVEYNEHVFGPGRAAATTDAVERMTGRPARSWRDFLTANAGALRG